MRLVDHLRELRRRVLISVGAILVGAIAGWWKYEQIFDELARPVTDLQKERTGGIVTVSFTNITDSFSIAITVGLFVGVVLASPIWLYQIWGFVVPGLTRREKRTAVVFLGAAVPLFLGGCALAYVTLPKAISALLGFTPNGASNVLPAADYLNFVLKFILAFGVAFLLPVFLVGVNAAGVLPARVMVRAWRPAIFIIFLFAAMMTPSPDPWSMIFLGLPMVALFFLAVGVSFILDRRRATKDPTRQWSQLADDEASPL